MNISLASNKAFKNQSKEKKHEHETKRMFIRKTADKPLSILIRFFLNHFKSGGKTNKKQKNKNTIDWLYITDKPVVVQLNIELLGDLSYRIVKDNSGCAFKSYTDVK